MVDVFVETWPETNQGSSGSLAGLRFAAKDLFDVDDRAPTCGLAVAPYPSLGTTAAVIARLHAAGAVLAGFVTMTPLAYEPSGANPARGKKKA